MENSSELLVPESRQSEEAVDSAACLHENRHPILRSLKADRFEELGDCKCVKLYNIHLAALPHVFCSHAACLEELVLSHCDLPKLPQNFVCLSKLKSLILEGNALVHLPDDFGNLVELQYVDLAFNALTALPDSLSNLVAITELHLEGNKLTKLPTGFGQLRALRQLHLEENLLQELPDDVGDLQALEKLCLRNNYLTELPDSFRDLKGLQDIDLRGNTLTVAQAVALQKLAEDSHMWPSLKLGRLTKLKAGLVKSLLPTPRSFCACGQVLDPPAKFCMHCGKECEQEPPVTLSVERTAAADNSVNNSAWSIGGFFSSFSGQRQGSCSDEGHALAKRSAKGSAEEVCSTCSAQWPRYTCKWGCDFRACTKCFEQGNNH